MRFREAFVGATRDYPKPVVDAVLRQPNASRRRESRFAPVLWGDFPAGIPAPELSAKHFVHRRRTADPRRIAGQVVAPKSSVKLRMVDDPQKRGPAG